MSLDFAASISFFVSNHRMAAKINHIALFVSVLVGMAAGTTVVNRILKPDMSVMSFVKKEDIKEIA